MKVDLEVRELARSREVDLRLLVIDEVNAPSARTWVFPRLLRLFEERHPTMLVVVMAGSAGPTVPLFQAALGGAPKVRDVLDRIEGSYAISELSPGDRVVVFVAALLRAAERRASSSQKVRSSLSCSPSTLSGSRPPSDSRGCGLPKLGSAGSCGARWLSQSHSRTGRRTNDS